jgi:hypothetical protein
MKKVNFKQLLLVAALFAAAISFSSCNRGYGCPNNFSINTVTNAAASVLK